MFYLVYKTEDLSQGHSLSKSSGKRLQRGKPRYIGVFATKTS